MRPFRDARIKKYICWFSSFVCRKWKLLLLIINVWNTFSFLPCFMKDLSEFLDWLDVHFLPTVQSFTILLWVFVPKHAQPLSCVSSMLCLLLILICSSYWLIINMAFKLKHSILVVILQTCFNKSCQLRTSFEKFLLQTGALEPPTLLSVWPVCALLCREYSTPLAISHMELPSFLKQQQTKDLLENLFFPLWPF